jgi:hypothetical protein
MSQTLQTTAFLNATDTAHRGPRSERQNRRHTYIRFVPLLVLLLLTTWTIDGVRVAWQGMETALRPVATCGTEMHILDGVACVARREPLYPPIDGLPLAYHLYNPLTYLPAGLIGRWLQLETDGLLIAGRCLSLASALGILLLATSFVWRSTGSAWTAALAAPMLLYFHSATLTDFFRNRPETAAIMLSLAAWITAQFRPRGWAVWSALAAVAAIAFKPTFVAAPVAVAVQLLCERQLRAMGQFLAVAAACGFAVVCGSYLFLGEGYFEHTVWAMMSNPIDPLARSLELYPLLAMLHWGWLLPVALFSTAWLLFRRSDLPLLLYLSVCLIVTTLAHGKLGSDVNYHGELAVLMVLTTLTAIGRMHGFATPLIYLPLAGLLLGAGSAIVTYGPTWNNLSLSRSIPHPYVDASQNLARNASYYVARYAPYRGRALILDDEIAVRVGEPVVYDWYGLTLLFDSGHVDFRLLEQAVHSREYTVVVLGPLPDNKWTCRLREAALSSGYRLTRQDFRVEEYFLPSAAAR